jgi:hypothetical protein
MPSDVLSCPYCNSAVTPPAGARPGQRIPCPRCGESFPLRETVPDDAVPAAPPPVEAPVPPAPPRISNGRIALLVLGGMVAMALIGLAYALHTQALRRSYDIELPKSRSIDVPIIARVALGLYVAGLVGAIVWGWNRRERAAAGTEPRPWTSRVGVPGLAVLALVGIGLALLAIRARPVRPPLDLDHIQTEAVAPAELAALGYLPDDTDMIVALHVGELRNDATGRGLLQQVGLGGAGAPELEKWTGLRLDEIDHATLGLKLDDKLLTDFVLVVRARRPLDEPRVREALKAAAKQEVKGRPVYPFDLKTGLDIVTSIRVFAWFADERTLVIAKDFGRIPLTPKPGIDHLRPALRDVIKERMGSSAQAWLAARVDSWDRLNFFLRQPLENELDRDADTFKKVRTLALWLAADDGVTLRGAFDCDNEDAAKALRAYLEPSNRRGVKALVNPREAGPMAREMLDSFKATQHGTWVDLQAKASAEATGEGKPAGAATPRARH